ncbi:NADH-ubiquinone oxidoreductase [Biscogniauxia sp. FL1348]|nr:NADH-ubiquinone oxidoreductase [Biscogniauxia sp. FL1348]KAI0596886.1 NADH-ubiquinone oxidoreductase [Biscogniauxia sp. FL1348]
MASRALISPRMVRLAGPALRTTASIRPYSQSASSSPEDAPTALAEAKPASRAVRPANSPEYGVHIDKATSTFTPVPKRVMDGSEEGEIVPAAVLSGAPIELQARTVRIFRPSKPATQSGNWGGHHWRMEWDVLPKGHRWENPLMGWQSSGDIMQGTRIEFKTKEDAIRFAEKQGYEYFVQEPNERAFAPKAYANNFLYSPKKLKHIRTK